MGKTNDNPEPSKDVMDGVETKGSGAMGAKKTSGTVLQGGRAPTPGQAHSCTWMRKQNNSDQDVVGQLTQLG